MNTKIIKLDINKKMFETITAKQGDTKSRFILFNLYDGPIQFDLTGRTVRVYGKKKDNTTIFNDLVITDAKKGYCTLELTNQMLAVEGMNELELVIFEGEKRLSTMPFILNVIASKYSEDAIVSTNEFTALMNALKTVSDIDNKAEKKEVEKLSEQLDNINKLKQLNTDLYSKFLNKLRKNEAVTICCMGNSETYGTDFYSNDKRPADTNKTDNGTSHTATRASKTYPEALSEYLNSIYQNKVTVINHGYSGDGAKLGFEHWNASGCDLAIINYAINDASNNNIDYMGDVETFLYWYRKVIERELLNGTAVILVTPPKQRIASQTDTDSRMIVDIFGNGVLMLAKEYNCPCIDGHVLMEGASSKHYSDYTHYNGSGYTIYGARATAPFVGEGAHKPYVINGYDYLGANPLLDNFKLTGENAKIILNSDIYPSPDESEENKGMGVWLKDGSKVTYSFYCEQPNIVVIPSVYSSSENTNIIFELDFGLEQGRFQNYWTAKDETPVDWSYIEPSILTISKLNLIDYNGTVYTSKNTKKKTDPRIIITSRGWHTITVKTNFGNTTDSCTLYGLEFFTYNDYLNKTYSEKEVTLLSGQEFDEKRKPVLEVYNNGRCHLRGALSGLTQVSNTEPIAKIDSKYAPNCNTVFTVALTSSTSGGYGVVLVTETGNIFLVYASDNIANGYSTLFGVDWSRKL